MPREYLVISRERGDEVAQSIIEMEFYDKEDAIKFASRSSELQPGCIYEVLVREARFGPAED